MKIHKKTRVRATAAALLSALACVGLMLEQVRVPFHLALHEHCFSHGSSECDTGHGHEHEQMLTESHYDLHHPAETPEEHCPHSVADHLGELPQLASSTHSAQATGALPLTAHHLSPAEFPLLGVMLAWGRDLRPPPPPRPAAPRGPPSLV